MIDIPSMVYETMKHERESKTLHPSAIDQCVLQSVFRIKGQTVTHPKSEESKWFLARYGTYEEYFLKAFDGHEVLLLEQPAFRMGEWSGRADFLIEDPNNGDILLVEVKSVNPGAIKRGNIPYKHHKLQVWTYCIMERYGEIGHGFDKAILAYIERWDDNKVPKILQYDVTPMEMELKLTQQRMAQFDDALEQDEYPIRPYETPEKHPWDCTGWNNSIRRREIRCPYFGHCWPGMENAYINTDDFPF